MQRQSRVAFENVRPKEGLRTEFKYQTVVFPGAKLPDNLVCVDAYMSLYTCRSASPESLSTHIVHIDTKTVTTVKTGGGDSVSLSACTQSCDICLYFYKTIV